MEGDGGGGRDGGFRLLQPLHRRRRLVATRRRRVCRCALLRRIPLRRSAARSIAAQRGGGMGGAGQAGVEGYERVDGGRDGGANGGSVGNNDSEVPTARWGGLRGELWGGGVEEAGDWRRRRGRRLTDFRVEGLGFRV